MADLKTNFVETIYKRYKLKIEKWQPNKLNYPEYMFLGGDRGILAYIYLLDDEEIPINEIVKKASDATKIFKTEYVYDEHLFYTLLNDEENNATKVLINLGIDPKVMMEDILDMFNF